MNDDPITRHFFGAFIRLHILHHAAQEAIYGAEIAEELTRHGYRVSQGTLYPVLHELAEAGFLVVEQRQVAGRWRKYYSATPAGREVLALAQDKLRELVAEVLEGKDEPFQEIRERLAREQTGEQP